MILIPMFFVLLVLKLAGVLMISWTGVFVPIFIWLGISLIWFVVFLLAVVKSR